jgi:hypothetical protein
MLAGFYRTPLVQGAHWPMVSVAAFCGLTRIGRIGSGALLDGNRVFLAIFAASLGVLRGKGHKNPDREAAK